MMSYRPDKHDELPRLFCDGGCAGSNPSTVGGTYAFVTVTPVERAGVVTLDVEAGGAGVIVPTLGALQSSAEVAGRDMTADWRAEYVEDVFVTNNVAELVALVRGLESLPEGWTGTVYSDSQVTLGRAFRNWATAGVPPGLVERMTRAKARLGPLGYTLLAGHPTRQETLEGFSARRGLPVSEFNVLCDKLCAQKAAELMRHFDLDRMARDRYNAEHAGGGMVTA